MSMHGCITSPCPICHQRRYHPWPTTGAAVYVFPTWREAINFAITTERASKPTVRRQRFGQQWAVSYPSKWTWTISQ